MGLLKKISRNLSRSSYMKFYKKNTIVPNTVLLEASHGKSVQGNIYYILKELVTNDEYSKYDIYVTINSKKQIKHILDMLKVDNRKINFVVHGTKKYYSVVSSVKYLINDTTFSSFFIKKEGQVYLNVWHGTPLKTLGKRVKQEPHKIGNIQKNFMMADYLLYPSTYMRDIMLEDYMVSNISKAKVLLAGYPRNAVFFDDEKRKEVIDRYSLNEKKVYVYMPTWRGAVNNVVDDGQIISNYLREIDSQLHDDEIMYVKMHPYIQNKLDMGGYNHIYHIPEEYECYEILNAADCLITDYSSVLYDFAVTRNNIVLFTYDEEEYLRDRGLYESIDNMPFPRAKTAAELLPLVRQVKRYDDKDFLEKYCNFETEHSVSALCRFILFGKESQYIKAETIKSNDKENVLLFVGSMAKNGITTSLLNLLNEIDTEKYNYYVTCRDIEIAANKDILFSLPENVNYYMIQGGLNDNLFEKAVGLLYRFNNIIKVMPFSFYLKTIKPVYENEIKRVYWDAEFSNVVQFYGYDYKYILFYSLFDTNRIIFVHNDMIQELKNKKNQREEVLRDAYDEYDKIAIVTEDLRESTCKLVNDPNKICVAKNVIDHKTIKEKSQLPLLFDENTKCNIPYENLRELLDSNSKKFLNVGRFSYEKGHKRLIDAFERIYSENQDTYLIIVGGYQRGNMYEELIEYAGKLNCRNNVVLIFSMSNPYPLIKKCDSFVLSSYYEGFGLVLAEADILGLPVVSTDIPGPRTFMEKHGGTLVEDSTEGIYAGMGELLDGKVRNMTVDYDEYNKDATDDFELLLD